MPTSSSTSYLAFDLGASSGRAVLGTLTDGHFEVEELHRFETPLVDDGEHLTWDLDTLWQELRTGFDKALQTAPALRSLSVDSWAVDYVPLSTDGDVLRPPYAYRDERTQGRMEQAFQTVPATRIYDITGIQFLPFNTLYQVLADQEQHPDLRKQTAQHLTIADYFNYRFGGRAVMDQSMASTTQLMDVHAFEWSAELMEAFGIDRAAWPDVVPCGTRLGTVPARLLTPRPDSSPSRPEVVASCSHDTACAVAAVPADASPAWAYVSCGTWSLLGIERNRPVVTDNMRRAGFTNEVGLDGTIRLLKNLTGLWPLQECARVWQASGPADYDRLVAEAASARPGIAEVDLDDDRFLARGDDMEARIKDFCRETGQAVPQTRGELVRVILESLAASYRRTLADLNSLIHTPIDTLHLVGGGAHNELLCQLTADACSCTVVAGPTEATALGNLAIQARTMGDLSGGDSVRDLVRRSARPKTFIPDPTTV